MNTELSNNVHWVGFIDWSVRDFHGYRTERGSTYNAYLVSGEKLALIDTVKAPYVGELLERVRSRVALTEAQTYYANIVMPYGRPVAAALAKLGTLPLKMIAPSHGVVWRSHIPKIMAAYQDWMVCKANRKVVIAYASMWNSTRVMAETMAAGALESDVDVRLVDIDTVHDTDIVSMALDCACLAFGSPTLNQGIMPRMAAALTYLRGLRPTGKSGLVFGSYGWAAGGIDELVRYQQAMQITPLCEPIKSKFRPNEAMLQQCREAGWLLAKKAMEA